jgi:hypothetical protein
MQTQKPTFHCEADARIARFGLPNYTGTEQFVQEHLKIQSSAPAQVEIPWESKCAQLFQSLTLTSK